MAEIEPDIRDRAYLTGQEVLGLNFIRKTHCRVFRKYYRAGLRSHIFEVLKAEDVRLETEGEESGPVRRFPKARPDKVLRILRTRFDRTETVLDDIGRYKILAAFLGEDLIARSQEFIVDYIRAGSRQIVLCGLQDYVEGEILDPWVVYGPEYLVDLYRNMKCSGDQCRYLAARAEKTIRRFVARTRQMIGGAGFIPDLAGVGNLVLTPEGGLKLVDINNIVEIRLDGTVMIDDKGYPSCDKSIEVLSILEEKILEHRPNPFDPLYRVFLTPERKERVAAIERAFVRSHQA